VITQRWLLQPGLLNRIPHGQLHPFGDGLQALRQTNDVAHIGAFAVVDDALPAKPRVTPKHNSHLGPMLAQTLEQQFENSWGAGRRTAVAGRKTRTVANSSSSRNSGAVSRPKRNTWFNE
jgi:hypothetical protein